MTSAFFTGMITGMVIVILAVFLFVFVMRNAVFTINCDRELSTRVQRVVSLYETEQYIANRRLGE